MDGWTNGWTGVSNSEGLTVARHSNDLSIHQWVRSAVHDSQQQTSPIGFLSLKLPPPPYAVLLVCISVEGPCRFPASTSLLEVSVSSL